jgi:hypothetical protein
VTAALRLVNGTGTRETVKWAHGKHKPRVKGATALIDAAAPSPPYVLRFDLYTTPDPMVTLDTLPVTSRAGVTSKDA